MEGNPLLWKEIPYYGRKFPSSLCLQRLRSSPEHSKLNTRSLFDFAPHAQHARAQVRKVSGHCNAHQINTPKHMLL